MEKLVKIYVLIDPFTLRVRYIGRTVVSLPMRLSQHVHCAKTGRLNTHKENWIRSLLKLNSRPYIKKLTEIEGWSESYKIECALISKYKERLVNHDDRGEGSLRNLSQLSKDKISDSLKEAYTKGLENVARKTVYAYNEDGTFYKEYVSIRKAAEDLGLYFRTVSKHCNGVISAGPTKDGRSRFLRKGKQFSFTKVEKMYDYT